jgi:hypothetical protein
MAEEKPGAEPTPINETPATGPNEPEARTPQGDAAEAAKTYAQQAMKAKGTQDPYPYDPTNELLDGDDSPMQDELSARGVRVSDSGRALVTETDPTGVLEVPPPNSNLELMKRNEKMAVALDEADGVDPEIGIKARQQARKQAAQARAKAAKESGGQAQPPQGRQAPKKAQS